MDFLDYGAEVKILQYDTQIDEMDKNSDQINFTESMKTLFGETLTAPLNNCILINIEKDAARYFSSVAELKKLSIENFVHLKATYWKNRCQLETDLTFVLQLLKQFNPDISTKNIKIDMFSELNDKNIHIQDGPLACYCSHLRAMIYGYTNFDKYTIVAEDDINIVNTELIDNYLKCMPDDWDIICFNSIPKKLIQNRELYKYDCAFHSTHMYIIKNKSMPILFKYMYPIVDQVDVLISNARNELNIYNLPRTVYQKSVSTNTQNNLHVIFTSPNYVNIKAQFDIANDLLLFFAAIILPNNKYNQTIVTNLIFDVICGCISNISDVNMIDISCEMPPVSQYTSYAEYDQLLSCVSYIIECTKKGVDIKIIAKSLVDSILDTLMGFNLHDTFDEQYSESIKAYSFGATSHTYILEKNNVCIKKYDKVLRWKHSEHNNINDIYKKEINVLKTQTCIKLISHDDEKKIIKMSYGGESLYNHFCLPVNWQEQIKKLFDDLTQNGIYYPEFRLHNILNNNNKLTFIDFGLAKKCDKSNDDNCKIFIELLSLLEKRFADTTTTQRHLLYDTFINGIKLHKIEKYLGNIF